MVTAIHNDIPASLVDAYASLQAVLERLDGKGMPVPPVVDIVQNGTTHTFTLKSHAKLAEHLQSRRLALDPDLVALMCEFFEDIERIRVTEIMQCFYRRGGRLVFEEGTDKARYSEEKETPEIIVGTRHAARGCNNPNFVTNVPAHEACHQFYLGRSIHKPLFDHCVQLEQLLYPESGLAMLQNVRDDREYKPYLMLSDDYYCWKDHVYNIFRQLDAERGIDYVDGINYFLHESDREEESLLHAETCCIAGEYFFSRQSTNSLSPIVGPYMQRLVALEARIRAQDIPDATIDSQCKQFSGLIRKASREFFGRTPPSIWDFAERGQVTLGDYLYCRDGFHYHRELARTRAQEVGRPPSEMQRHIEEFKACKIRADNSGSQSDLIRLSELKNEMTEMMLAKIDEIEQQMRRYLNLSVANGRPMTTGARGR